MSCQVVDDQLAHCGASLDSAASGVGRQHDIIQCGKPEKDAVHSQNIEAGSCDCPLLQGRDQSSSSMSEPRKTLTRKPCGPSASRTQNEPKIFHKNVDRGERGVIVCQNVRHPVFKHP